ncbi:MAG: hypothetical protein V1701_03830 [Planctomycetota bacterium]
MRHYILILWFTIIFLFVSGCWYGKQVEFVNKDSNADSLSKALNTIVKEESSSYQRVLWKASHTVKEYCLDREWLELKSSLQNQGLVCISSNEYYSEHFCGEAIRRYMVRKDIYFTNIDYPHDLYIELSMEKIQEQIGKVLAAEAGLVSEINAPYNWVMKQKRYLTDSAVSRVLETDEVKETALKFPIIDKIEITYDLMKGREGYGPYGFRVYLIFRAQDGKGGATLHFTVESGLDPVRFRDEQKSSEEFISQDTLGKIKFRGGSEW